MPQMAPILWSLMFFMFSLFLVSTFIKLSFSICSTAPASSGMTSFKPSKKNWQW